ncbi:transposase family protein [Pseudonocardia kujensis]|nr:transposase family protein [Pseudonocardia kujensis]
MAHLREGETYADPAAGFDIGTTTVFRYITEAVENCWPRPSRARARRSRSRCARPRDPRRHLAAHRPSRHRAGP